MSSERPILICSHLVMKPDGHHVWFTGRRSDCHWVCRACAAAYPQLPTDMIETTNEVFETCQSESSWQGICGSPEIKYRPSPLQFTHDEFRPAFLNGDRCIDVQPNLQSNGKWFVLMQSGDFAIVDFRTSEFAAIHRVANLGIEIDDETCISVSKKHDYFAIFGASDRHACVIDFASGEVTARIDRGEYRPENSHFPIAFFESFGRTLLVAATDWNRLDIIDPANGLVLTDRGPTSYQQGDQRPPHYLDYFHAQLLVSPNQDWIVDNGWAWHPWGSVESWNLGDWLHRNPWESEDGPSRKTLASRAYYWDGPLCWIDDTTIAVWGWGHDDEWLVPAVVFYDVKRGRQLRWFAGPETRRPSAWAPKKLAPSLFFDQYLFSVHDEHGTGVWDIENGEQLIQEPSLMPIHYHSGSQEFLSRATDGFRLSRLGQRHPTS